MTRKTIITTIAMTEKSAAEIEKNGFGRALLPYMRLFKKVI